VHALEGRASLTTVAWARENRTPPVGEDVETNLFLYEYFRLNMVNIGGQQLALHTQGRVRWNRLGEEQWDGRLYQGYFDWKPTKSINFRAGRQFLPNDVGFWQMDGVRINLNFLEPISPSIYGGMAAPPWSLVGDKKGVFGVDIGRRMFGTFQTRASVLELFNQDSVRTILGLRLEIPGTSIFDVHRDTRERIHISVRGSADLLTHELISGTTSIAFRPVAATQISAAYRHETPLFPEDSIFSVFAIEPIQELSVGFDTGLNSWLELHGRYAHQFFDIGEIDRYTLGFAITSQRGKLLHFQLERLDDGIRRYWRTYSSLNRSVTKRWQIGLSHYYNNYQFSPITQVERAYSFQFNTNYQFRNDLRLLVRIEDNINPDFRYNIRGYGSLRFDFGF
jgi:hypothetical protein